MTSALLKLIGLALLTLLLVRSLRTSGHKNTLATNAPPPPPERLRFAVRRRQQKKERLRQRKEAASLSSPPPPLPIIGHTREAPLSTAAAADVPPHHHRWSPGRRRPLQECWGRVRCDGAGARRPWAVPRRDRAQGSPRSLRILPYTRLREIVWRLRVTSMGMSPSHMLRMCLVRV